MDSFSLPCTKHPRQYHLQWLNEGLKVKVVKQSLVTSEIGNYTDDVWCDVVLVHTTHLLLGRP